MRFRKKFSVTIFGENWAIYMLNDKHFDKACGATNNALTIYNHARHKRIIVFRATALDKITVHHEVVHAFYSYQYLDSAQLLPEQMEEVFCDLKAIRGKEMTKVANTIYRKLKSLL